MKKKRASSVTKHYVAHKSAARELVLERLQHFNQHYGLTWNRVAIRNQKRCWGICSSKKNLNFSYKLLWLPPHLRDYIIVHELCHLVEMNHGKNFWQLVAEQVPDYKRCVAELKVVDRKGQSIAVLSQLATQDTFVVSDILNDTQIKTAHSTVSYIHRGGTARSDESDSVT